MTETNEALLALLEPFPPEMVGKLPRVTCKDCSDYKVNCTKHQRAKCETCGGFVSTKHIHLDYVGHADVTRRLLEIDPAWDWEPLAEDENGLPILDTDAKDNPVGMWIKLTVLGVTRRGYGSCPSGQNDAVKVLIGDALRNAAMRFGVALDLWAKGDRADPSAENAVHAGGQAARRRPAAPPPPVMATATETDWKWANRFETRAAAAGSQGELKGLWEELVLKHQTGGITASDADDLKKLLALRKTELEESPAEPPRNQDGSISRSRMTDEELAAGGHMTGPELREHNKLVKDVRSSPKQAERLATTPEDDPWTTAPAEGGEES